MPRPFCLDRFYRRGPASRRRSLVCGGRALWGALEGARGAPCVGAARARAPAAPIDAATAAAGDARGPMHARPRCTFYSMNGAMQYISSSLSLGFARSPATRHTHHALGRRAGAGRGCLPRGVHPGVQRRSMILWIKYIHSMYRAEALRRLWGCVCCCCRAAPPIE